MFITAQAAAQSPPQIWISEVYPAGRADGEWFELSNSSDAEIQLEGWTIADAFGQDPLPPIAIPAGASIVIAASSNADVEPLATIEDERIGRGLNDDGDDLILTDPTGAEHDRVSWGDETTAAPKAGTSLQRDAPDSQPKIEAPTPGEIQPAPPTENASERVFLTLRISEIMPNPSEGEEWVELHNFGPAPVQLEGWQLGDASGLRPLEGTIEPGQRHLVRGQIGNRLNNRGDTVLLAFGETTIDSVEYGTEAIPAPARGRSLARAASWYIATDPTPGAPSGQFPLAEPGPDPESEIIEQIVYVPLTVRITEIMRETETAPAWIELHNFGTLKINPDQWYLGSDQPQLPLLEPIPAGGYIMVHDDARIALAPGDERLSLWYEPPDGEPLQADAVEFAALPQPPAGTSIALINGIWAVLENPTPGSPGGVSAASAPEPSPAPDQSPPQPALEQSAQNSLNPWLVVSAALMALLAVIILRSLFPRRTEPDDFDDPILADEPPYDGLDQPPLDFEPAEPAEPADAEPPPRTGPHPWD